MRYRVERNKIIRIALSTLFLICLFDMPYGYYQLVRFLGMLGFFYLAYVDYKTNRNSWAIFYIISAILINPIFKISLGRELWNIVDIIWAIVLLSSFMNKSILKKLLLKTLGKTIIYFPLILIFCLSMYVIITIGTSESYSYSLYRLEYKLEFYMNRVFENSLALSFKIYLILSFCYFIHEWINYTQK